MFGSGPSIRPPAPELVKELQAQGVGLEVSNTVRLPDPTTSIHARAKTYFSGGPTVCGTRTWCSWRLWGGPLGFNNGDLGCPAQVNAIATFNILAQEGRHVVGAFVPMTTET